MSALERLSKGSFFRKVGDIGIGKSTKKLSYVTSTINGDNYEWADRDQISKLCGKTTLNVFKTLGEAWGIIDKMQESFPS